MTSKVTGTGIETANLTDVAGNKYGRIVQVVNVQSGAVATGTNLTPNDDSIPQLSEQNIFMTRTITPVSASNILQIEVVMYSASTSNGDSLNSSLFQDSGSAAIACIAEQYSNANHPVDLSYTHTMVAGTTSEITFKVGSAATGGTTTFNGVAGLRKYGGVAASSITITEIRV